MEHFCNDRQGKTEILTGATSPIANLTWHLRTLLNIMCVFCWTLFVCFVGYYMCVLLDIICVFVGHCVCLVGHYLYVYWILFVCSLKRHLRDAETNHFGLFCINSGNLLLASECLSVPMYHRCSHWKDFREI